MTRRPSAGAACCLPSPPTPSLSASPAPTPVSPSAPPPRPPPRPAPRRAPPAPPAAGAGAPLPRLFIAVDGSTRGVAAALPRDAGGRPSLDERAAATLQQSGSSAGEVSAAGLAPAATRLVAVVSNLHPE